MTKRVSAKAPKDNGQPKRRARKPIHFTALEEAAHYKFYEDVSDKLTTDDALRKISLVLGWLQSITAMRSHDSPLIALMHEIASALEDSFATADHEAIQELHKVARKYILDRERKEGHRFASTDVDIITPAEYVAYLRRLIDNYKNGGFRQCGDRLDLALEILCDGIVYRARRAFPDVPVDCRYLHVLRTLWCFPDPPPSNEPSKFLIVSLRDSRGESCREWSPADDTDLLAKRIFKAMGVPSKQYDNLLNATKRMRKTRAHQKKRRGKAKSLGDS